MQFIYISSQFFFRTRTEQDRDLSERYIKKSFLSFCNFAEFWGILVADDGFLKEKKIFAKIEQQIFNEKI